MSRSNDSLDDASCRLRDTVRRRARGVAAVPSSLHGRCDRDRLGALVLAAHVYPVAHSDDALRRIRPPHCGAISSLGSCCTSCLSTFVPRCAVVQRRLARPATSAHYDSEASETPSLDAVTCFPIGDTRAARLHRCDVCCSLGGATRCDCPVAPSLTQVARRVFGATWHSDLGLALISLMSGTPIIAGTCAWTRARQHHALAQVIAPPKLPPNCCRIRRRAREVVRRPALADSKYVFITACACNSSSVLTLSHTSVPCAPTPVTSAGASCSPTTISRSTAGRGGRCPSPCTCCCGTSSFMSSTWRCISSRWV